MRRRKGASGCDISYQLNSEAEEAWFHSTVSDVNNYFMLLITFTKSASYLTLCQTAHIPISLLQHRRITQLCAEQHEHISQHKKKELRNFFTYQGAVQLSHNFSLEWQLSAKMKISAYSSNTGRVTKEHALFFPKLPLCSSLPSSLAPEIQVNIYTTELAVLLLRFWIHRIPKKVPICAQKFRTSTLCLITASRTPAQLQWSWTPHSNLISNLTG